MPSEEGRVFRITFHTIASISSICQSYPLTPPPLRCDSFFLMVVVAAVVLKVLVMMTLKIAERREGVGGSSRGANSASRYSEMFLAARHAKHHETWSNAPTASTARKVRVLRPYWCGMHAS